MAEPTLNTAKFSAYQIATFFINKALETGKELTPMKLLKLVYISQGVHLVINDGVPLFEEKIYAWKLGPVVDILYHAYKRFGNGQINEETPLSEEVKNDSEVMAELEDVWNVFGKWSGIKLSNWTHEPGSPWDTVWNKMGGSKVQNAVIHNPLIKDYFQSFVTK